MSESERDLILNNRFGGDIVRAAAAAAAAVYLNSAPHKLHGGLFMRNHKAT